MVPKPTLLAFPFLLGLAVGFVAGTTFGCLLLFFDLLTEACSILFRTFRRTRGTVVMMMLTVVLCMIA